MFPQQAALQTPSLQAAAKCPRPRSVARRGERAHTSAPSRGSSHSPATPGGAINTPGWAGAASWVMERQQQWGGCLAGCSWVAPAGLVPTSPLFLRDAELQSSCLPALVTLRMLLWNKQPGDAAATLLSAWWASPPGSDSGFG